MLLDTHSKLVPWNNRNFLLNGFFKFPHQMNINTLFYILCCTRKSQIKSGEQTGHNQHLFIENMSKHINRISSHVGCNIALHEMHIPFFFWIWSFCQKRVPEWRARHIWNFFHKNLDPLLQLADSAEMIHQQHANFLWSRVHWHIYKPHLVGIKVHMWITKTTNYYNQSNQFFLVWEQNTHKLSFCTV